MYQGKRENERDYICLKPRKSYILKIEAMYKTQKDN